MDRLAHAKQRLSAGEVCRGPQSQGAKWAGDRRERPGTPQLRGV